VRRFGVQDLDRHLGLLVKMSPNPSLYDTFDKTVLDQCNIPESQRTGLHGSTVFVSRKSDFMLQSNAPAVATKRWFFW
jgi:hypothetical protein